ncbi:hypothetical protein [Convivina intestini]|uniref:Uncharacterized protein n=1 Tax=Convivina intestini TaxID=1505726 RepID=A0A2U1DBU6_9LACO|nr:hypothetical protein [Convivina intestini]PVY85069.1 hypothetical protein C7384_10394 [Convivina intestini]CAH1853596.1 hypothetical protein R077811_00746 [Convivina intestini]CAH1855560.1 hypothetical protein R078131_01211 [Convivina intestini]SDB88918.1 hypothetical protein SAMN05216341_10360 [Leuconostocaceae bacterium R-53105]
MFKEMKLLKPSWITALLVIVLSLLSIQNYRVLPAKEDIIFAAIHWHGPVLLTQTLLLCLIAWQVVSFRKIRFLVAIRGKDEVIQKNLLKLMTMEVIGYFILFDGSYLLTGHPIFSKGPVIIGILMLVLRMVLVWFLGLLLITTYTAPYPGLILLGVLVVNLFYHYVIEMNFLLIQYSQTYDPLWKAFNLNR